MKVSQLKENIRNIVRKKLSEVTIDVTNPASETPATKRVKIATAIRTTGDKTIGTEKNPVEFIEETEEFTMDRIWKMNRNELIKFLGLNAEEAKNWGDRELQGAALEMADDKPKDDESIDEADFIDDDDIVHEGVDDDNTDFKDYDSIYELGMADDFEANVGSGHRGLSVKLHPMDSRFILISQDNGQRVVVSVEDAYELINKLKELA
jgi:hypothetical protein